jgi:hypothetical protein
LQKPKLEFITFSEVRLPPPSEISTAGPAEIPVHHSNKEVFMRKILLASAAVLGASGGLALAQTSQVPANPSQGQLAAPYAGGASYNSNNNAWGIANTPSGSAA